MSEKLKIQKILVVERKAHGEIRKMEARLPAELKFDGSVAENF